MKKAVVKVGLFCDGSRGDTQPFIALARGLDAAGFEAYVIASSYYEDFVRGCGVKHFRSLQLNSKELVDDLMRATDGSDIDASIQSLTQMYDKLVPVRLKECLPLCKEMDVVVFSNANFLWMSTIVEYLKKPAIYTPLQNVFLCEGNVCSLMDPRAIHEIKDEKARLQFQIDQMENFMKQLNIEKNIDPWRQEHGLQPVQGDAPLGMFMHNIIANDDRYSTVRVCTVYSPVLDPVPSAALQTCSRLRRASHMFLQGENSEWVPPADVEDFMTNIRKEGKQLCYVGFGSMTAADSLVSFIRKQLLDAVERLPNVGFVLLEGWGTLKQPADFASSPLSSRVKFVESIPHEWLFPRVEYVLQRNEINGTTGSVMRFGVPSAVGAFGFDQLYNGYRLHEIGMAAMPRMIGDFTADDFVDVISILLEDEQLNNEAKRISSHMMNEDGVGDVVRAIAELADTLL